jgi:hypothetical protein
VYSPEQRGFAKSLVVAHGSVAGARKHLEQLWVMAEAGGERPDGVPEPPKFLPTVATLTAWRDNPLIPVDRTLVDEFQRAARGFVAGSALRIATEAEAAVLSALRDNQATDAEKFGRVWSHAVAALAPREPAATGSLLPNPAQMAPGQRAIMTFEVQAPPFPVAISQPDIVEVE